MDKWTIKRYAVKRLNSENKIEYWNFFFDEWVSPEKVNDDCVTTPSTASCVHNEYYGSEIVEMKITIEEN